MGEWIGRAYEVQLSWKDSAGLWWAKAPETKDSEMEAKARRLELLRTAGERGSREVDCSVYLRKYRVERDGDKDRIVYVGPAEDVA